MAKLPEDEPRKEGWIVSYADLMTLLFAFFVVLYGIKPEGQTVALLGVTSNIREAFIEIPDEIPPDERPGPILQGKEIFKNFKGDAMTEPVIRKYRRAENAHKVINKDRLQVQELVDKINATASPKGDGQKVMDVQPTPEGFKLKIVAHYFYAPGEHRFRREVMQDLQQIGTFLKSLEEKIVISGHTDNIPQRKGMSNLELSALRAAYIAQFFIREVGIAEEFIVISGNGDLNPIAPNDTPEGRQMNRRVEIGIQYED